MDSSAGHKLQVNDAFRCLSTGEVMMMMMMMVFLLLFCSLGLVLPTYSENHIKANLSDQILQVQCKYRAELMPSPLTFLLSQRDFLPPVPPLNLLVQSEETRSPPFTDGAAVPARAWIPVRRARTSVNPHTPLPSSPPVFMLFCTEVIFLSPRGCKEKTLTESPER